MTLHPMKNLMPIPLRQNNNLPLNPHHLPGRSGKRPVKRFQCRKSLSPEYVKAIHLSVIPSAYQFLSHGGPSFSQINAKQLVVTANVSSAGHFSRLPKSYPMFKVRPGFRKIVFCAQKTSTHSRARRVQVSAKEGAAERKRMQKHNRWECFLSS